MPYFSAQARMYAGFQIFDPSNTFPGATEFTRMPYCPSSIAQPRAMWISPALVAL